jgi:hypothetical protein
MNSQTPHEDEVLARALRGQVDGMTEAPFTADQIAGRAGRIRRHRRLAVTAGVAAAVAAVAIPSAILAGSGVNRSQEPPVASQSPSTVQTATTEPTQSPSDSGRADGIAPFDLEGIPTGATPAVAWTDGTTLHRPDGTTVELPEKASSLVRAGDRYLVLGSYDDTTVAPVYVVEADGSVTDTGDRAFVLAGSGSGLTAAYATGDGEIKTYWSDGEVSLGSPDVRGDLVVRGVIGDGSCFESDGGCTVFFESKDGVGAADSHGLVEEGLPGALRAADAVATSSGWLLSTMRSSSDNGSCWDVTDAGWQTLWGSCRLAPLAFAPDAGHVLGSDSYFDGFGPSDLAIMDASDGTVLVHLGATEKSQVTPFDPVWEDDAHALTVTYSAGKWAVVRIGLDGSLEYAVAPVKAGEFDRPFVVQAS